MEERGRISPLKSMAVGDVFGRVMPFFARLSRDHARWVVLVCLLITLPVTAGTAFIKLKAGQQDLIPRKFETSLTIREVDQLFGGTTYEIAMVESDRLLTYPMIKKFLLLEEALREELGDGVVYVEHFLTGFLRNMLLEAQKEGFKSGDISFLLRFTEGTMVPDPDDPSRQAPFEQVIEKGVATYLADPVARAWTVEKKGSSLLSEDGRHAAIWVKVNPGYDSHQNKEFAARAERFFKGYFAGDDPPAEVYISGDPSIDKDLEDYVVGSSTKLALVALALLVVLLFLAFQRLTDVILPLSVVILTTFWIYGLMGWFGVPYTIISALIGPLVLGISLGNLVYIMGRFYEELGLKDREGGPRRSAYRAVTTVGVAVFLACVTTIIGFASFGFSDFEVLQELGYMTAAGIFICFLFCITFLPSLMVLREEWRSRRGESRPMHPPRGLRIFARDSNTFIDRALLRVAGVAERHPRPVAVLFVLMVAVCVSGAFRLTTVPDLRALAPQDLPSLQAQYLQEEVFGGQQQDVVLVEGEVLDPRSLQAMLDFQEELANSGYFLGYEKKSGSPFILPLGSSSVAELIRDFRLAMGRVSADGEGALPATADEAASDLTEIDELFGPQEGKLVAEGHRAALIAVYSEGSRTNEELKDKGRILREAAARHFGGAGLDYAVGGITPLTVDMLGNLVPTQVKTSILALILSGLVLVLVFRSVVYGMATLSVLVAGITVELGFLSLMGWGLDVMTVLVVSMIIGMGIDYGIHVTHRFLEERRGGEVSVPQALSMSVSRVGKPLLAGVVSTGGAFLVISLSEMLPIRRFGVITAISLATSFLASVLVLPSIITLTSLRRERRSRRPGA